MSDVSNELIISAAQGDMDAFEEIYKATSAFVYNVAFRIINNRNDADEVAQDVFIRAFNNLKGFGFRSSFKTWIYRITANTALNFCKKRSRSDQGKVEYDPIVHDVSASDDGRQELDKAEARHKVTALLGVLDPDQRACIVLREIEGLDYKSIADTLNININTVRSRLKRAREKLLRTVRKG